MTSANGQKVVLITGASSGIGRATAIEFAKLGYKIAFTGRNEERIKSTLDELRRNFAPINKTNCDLGQELLGLQINFENEKEVDSIVAKVVAKFGRLDILINNAGFTAQNHDLLDEGFFEDFKSVLQVNLIAAARLAQLAAPHLVAAPHCPEDPGVLINVSSVADRVAFKALAYCVSKAGLSMLTKTLANSLENRPVRVLAVSPGPVKTNIAPDVRVLEHMGNRATLLHRAGEPSEVADLIVFLCSKRASFIHGSTIDIDGGQVTKLGSLITEGLGSILG